MSPISPEALANYWSLPAVEINLLVFANLLGALALGLLVGYERSYHGRAAGMRTYGLVCVASAALTIIAGYPGYWFGGHTLAMDHAIGDPTRVIQGIVTGIGFLGAGVIMKEGFTISGLTTAASIWASSVIGVMIGLGFYAAGILLAVISALSMLWGSRLEQWLPSRPAVAITMCFRVGFRPKEEVLRRVASERGYDIASGTLAITFHDGHPEWRFVAIRRSKDLGESLSEIADELTDFEGILSFSITHARN
ncbi:MgtC/SapB family protein [Telmatospirillum sp.]|uniref:MgtC/SapB family protein n=1 Tax=Telmatospirillum sp. TaxID=2079197 RepID=UPI0028440BCB|nr:MgtC/SapB family protein [Telmatospirillum sp.]MDR3435869.1 MgtC/SapB family protein [Telmatospirillum sp.]